MEMRGHDTAERAAVPTLRMICGKIASLESTLAARPART